MGIKPTAGARERFQRLPAMLPAKVEFPDPPEGAGELATLEGTVVDVSPGGMCMRVAMDDGALEVMRQVHEGLFVEVRVTPSELRAFTVLGRVAWVWVPSMEGEDQVGSLGVDIKGVAEEDRSLVGKLRAALVREPEVEVDRSSRRIKTRTGRAAAAAKAEPSSSEAEPDGDEAEGGGEPD